MIDYENKVLKVQVNNSTNFYYQMILLYFFGYCRKIIILCHSYQIITFVPRYTILFPMVYRICMFCFFMDSIFLRMNFLVPEPINPLYDKLTQLHITETDIEDVLQLINTTKAAGPDLINPRLYKRRGFHLEASIVSVI
jgi:hypothetical protein